MDTDSEVNAALDFLNLEQEVVKQQGLRTTINALISKQLNEKMMASIKDDYLLSIIDPPIAPEIKSSPKRAIICILITIFGGLVSLIAALINHNRNKKYLNE